MRIKTKKRRGFTLIEMVVGIVLIGILMIPISIVCAQLSRAAVYVGQLAIAKDYLGNNIERENYWALGIEPVEKPGGEAAEYEISSSANYATGYAYGYEDILDFPNCKQPPLFYIKNPARPTYYGTASAIIDHESETDLGVGDFYKIKYGMRLPGEDSISTMEASTLKYLFPGWIYPYFSHYSNKTPLEAQTFAFTTPPPEGNLDMTTVPPTPVVMGGTPMSYPVSFYFNNAYESTAGYTSPALAYLTVFFERRRFFNTFQVNLDILIAEHNNPLKPTEITGWHWPAVGETMDGAEGYWHGLRIRYKYLNVPRIIGVELSSPDAPRYVQSIAFGKTPSSWGSLIQPSDVTPLLPVAAGNFYNYTLDPLAGGSPRQIGSTPVMLRTSDDSAYVVDYPALITFDHQGGPAAGVDIEEDICMQVCFSAHDGPDQNVTANIIFSDGSALSGTWEIHPQDTSGGSSIVIP